MRLKIVLLTAILGLSSGMAFAQGGPDSVGLTPRANSSSQHTRTIEPYSPRWNVSFLIGGATTPGNATLTLKAAGTPLFNQTSQTIDFDVSGIIIGMSLGYWINDRLSCRIDAFDLVPSPSGAQVTTTLQTGGPVMQRAEPHFSFDGIRGEGSVRLWGRFAVVGGLYYESLNLSLINAIPVVANLVNSTTLGSAEVHTLNLYLGAEYTLWLPFSSYITARFLGFPWIYCHWNYDMSFQNPTSLSPFFQNSGAGVVNNGAFGEILVRGAFGIGFAELGLFAKLSAVTLGNEVQINSQNVLGGSTVQQPFDMSFTRRTVEGGGFVVIPF